MFTCFDLTVHETVPTSNYEIFPAKQTQFSRFNLS